MQSLIQGDTLNMMLIMEYIKKIQNASSNSDEFLKVYFTNIIKAVAGWSRMINDGKLLNEYFQQGTYSGTQVVAKTQASSGLRTKVPFITTKELKLSGNGYKFSVKYLQDYNIVDTQNNTGTVVGVKITESQTSNNVITIKQGQYTILSITKQTGTINLNDIIIQ